MSITPELGKKAAITMAKNNTRSYEIVSRRYGATLDKYRGQTPRALVLAHVLRINPALITDPVYEGRDDRGFMKVSTEDAYEAKVDWKKLNEESIAAYAWLYALNNRAKRMHADHSKLFSEYAEDFWRTIYLNQSLGDAFFNYLWDIANPTVNDTSIYDKLLYTVNAHQKNAYNYTAEELRVLVMKEIEFVFQLALLKGNMSTTKPGENPTPFLGDYPELFNRGTK